MPIVLKMKTWDRANADDADRLVEEVEELLVDRFDCADHVDGFVEWVWDMRGQALADLLRGDESAIVEMCAELAHMINYVDEIAMKSEEQEDAALLYLQRHHSELVERLIASIDG